MTGTKMLTGFIALALLVSAPGAHVGAAEKSVRQERCDDLQRQLDKASKSGVTDHDVRSIDRLRKRAIYLCNNSKESQGVRTFAKALAILGLKPVDTSSQNTNRKPQG